MSNAELFKKVFGIYAEEFWAYPEEKKLDWLTSNVPGTNVGDTISRQWLMECVNEGWIKFDTEKDENRFVHLIRDIAPSAQPEIIRCKDCKYGSPNGKYGCAVYHYRRYETHDMESDDFCSRAERRINE